ncbi:MAG: bifunctional nicotinamidase/pyrazinamidase [Phycisphaeraceae bacterium]|nr:bifunctional nicotinamidase/pyrazinamidase [Phycisphaeraceae bacterium]
MPGTKALIVVDVQNDFLPGGALAVPNGDVIIPVINKLMERDFDLIVATADWHPPDHGSFASQHPGRNVGEVIELDGLEQVLWPDHCVQNTSGAAFHAELNAQRFARVFHKGMDRKIDSYSGFFDNGRRKDTGLDQYLRAQGVGETHIVGLAADYCVKATALHAVELGYRTILHTEATRAVNLKPDDGQVAIDHMRRAGVVLA